MAERPIIAELRAVDAALAPLAPSRELDSRIDALLAGRARRPVPRRLVFAGLGACAAVAAAAVWLGRAAPVAVASAHQAEAPSPRSAVERDRSPETGRAPEVRPVASPGLGGGTAVPDLLTREGASRPAREGASLPTREGAALATRERASQPAPAGLALVERAPVAAAPEEAPLRGRERQPLASPVEQPASLARVERRAVTGARPPPTVLVTREAADADAALEASLAAVRADKSRGDLRGAVARVDALLASGVSARVALALRIERARLYDRLGERAAACASLAGLDGDDAHDTRARLSCP